MWGLNNDGELGTQTSETIEYGDKAVSFSSFPLKVMSNVNYVSLGGGHSAVITNDGCLYRNVFSGNFLLDNLTQLIYLAVSDTLESSCFFKS